MLRKTKTEDEEQAVTPSADERAGGLAARVARARAEVADLASRMQTAAADAHAARVAADFDAADVHHAEAEDLRARLTAAESALAALEAAQREVGEERRIEQHTAALADAEQQRQEAHLRTEEYLSRIGPMIEAVRAEIAAAFAAQRELQEAAGRVHELRIALGAPRMLLSAPTPVSALLDRNPLWRVIQTGIVGS